MKKNSIKNLLSRAPEKLRCYDALKEVFMFEPYYWFVQNLKPHTTVIDVGAFVGETAIYFAIPKNVDRVIAYECDKQDYLMGLENIRRNPYRRKKIKLMLREVHSLECKEKNTVVKLDVEGAEAEILKNSDLRNVYKIQLEYHDTKQDCLDSLKSKGFRTRVDGGVGVEFKEIGYIYAWR
jgi:hypothetical protein